MHVSAYIAVSVIFAVLHQRLEVAVPIYCIVH